MDGDNDDTAPCLRWLLQPKINLRSHIRASAFVRLDSINAYQRLRQGEALGRIAAQADTSLTYVKLYIKEKDHDGFVTKMDRRSRRRTSK